MGNVISMVGRCRGAEEEVGCKSVSAHQSNHQIHPFPHSAGHNLIWVPALYPRISQLLQVSRPSPFWRLDNPFRGNLCTLCPQGGQPLAQRLLCGAEFGPRSCFWIRMLDIRRQLSMVSLCSEHVKALLMREKSLRPSNSPHPNGIHEIHLVPSSCHQIPANRTQRDSESFLFL